MGRCQTFWIRRYGPPTFHLQSSRYHHSQSSLRLNGSCDSPRARGGHLDRLPKKPRNNDEIMSKIDRISGISVRSSAPRKAAKIGEDRRVVGSLGCGRCSWSAFKRRNCRLRRSRGRPTSSSSRALGAAEPELRSPLPSSHYFPDFSVFFPIFPDFLGRLRPRQT